MNSSVATRGRHSSWEGQDSREISWHPSKTRGPGRGAGTLERPSYSPDATAPLRSRLCDPLPISGRLRMQAVFGNFAGSALVYSAEIRLGTPGRLVPLPRRSR